MASAVSEVSLLILSSNENNFLSRVQYDKSQVGYPASNINPTCAPPSPNPII